MLIKPKGFETKSLFFSVCAFLAMTTISLSPFLTLTCKHIIINALQHTTQTSLLDFSPFRKHVLKSFTLYQCTIELNCIIAAQFTVFVLSVGNPGAQCLLSYPVSGRGWRGGGMVAGSRLNVRCDRQARERGPGVERLSEAPPFPGLCIERTGIGQL